MNRSAILTHSTYHFQAVGAGLAAPYYIESEHATMLQ